MDPTGVFIVYDYFYIFFIQEDTVDMRAGEVGNLLYILCTPSPWASYIFAQVVLTFICWLTRSGVILGQ